MFAPFPAAALNHLLAQNDWAPERLARFAGKTARFDIAPFSFVCTVLADGMLRGAGAGITPNALCEIAPTLLPRLALHDEKAWADIRTGGDAALLEEILFLARALRWDAARDLGRVTGNAAAERIARAAQAGRQQIQEVLRELSKTASEYCTEEHPVLAGTERFSAFTRQVGALRDDVARLEQRVDRLSAARGL